MNPVHDAGEDGGACAIGRNAPADVATITVCARLKSEDRRIEPLQDGDAIDIAGDVPPPQAVAVYFLCFLWQDAQADVVTLNAARAAVRSFFSRAASTSALPLRSVVLAAFAQTPSGQRPSCIRM